MGVPTRLPYGLSFVKPSALFGATSGQSILGTGSSPDVSMGTYFAVNFSSNTIINFAGGERGKIIFINCQTGGVTIIQNSAGGIAFQNIIGTTSAGSTISFTTAGNITMLNNEILGFMFDGTEWNMLGGARFALSTLI